jgi:excisionase family DNA binding protein
MALWAACNAWLDYLHNPPDDPPEYDYDFDYLTEALQLWASLHGLGDGMALTDASILWYRPSARKSGLDALIRAEAFLQLIRNRAVYQMPQERAKALRAAREALRPKGGYTVRELARFLRVNADKVRSWIKRGELEAINTAMARCRKPRWVITPEALARFESRHKADTPPRPATRRKRQSQMIDYFP